jgi:predicted dehydrogenase
VDDAAVFLARLSGGGLATYEATRFATGRKNALRIEVNGSRGSLAFDLERLNELSFYDATDDAAVRGFRRILVTEPEHPYVAGSDPTPGFAAGLQVQLVLDAVLRSAADRGCWTPVDG